MGYYYIPCNQCGKTFGWFSGNTVYQICPECEGKQIMKDSLKPVVKIKQNTIQVFKLHSDAKTPTRNITTDAGADLYALKDTFIRIGTTAKIETGIAVNIPIGYVGNVFDRSSMALKGLAVGAGIVDAGFSGDCSVVIHNLNNKQDTDYYYYEGYLVKKGDKIAQMVIQKCLLDEIEVVDTLWVSERGGKGWGSSGN